VSPSRRSGLALLVGAALSWGAGIVVTKVALAQLAPLDLLGFELAVGAASIGGLRIATRGFRGLSGWRGPALLGLLEPTLTFALGDFGLARTGAADGAVLAASESLFAVLLAWIVLRERFGRRIGVAIAVGFAGSVLVGLGEAGRGPSLLGGLLILAASATAGAYSVMARSINREDTNALTVTAIQLSTSTLVAAPFVLGAFLTHRSRIDDADGAHLLAAVATGLLSTAIPFVLYNRAIAHVDVPSASLVLNLIPVVGVMLAIVFLAERPGWAQLAGGSIIVLAALTVETQDSDELSGEGLARGC
jgi:drug/metabolite transporter (DMT)-like permease